MEENLTTEELLEKLPDHLFLTQNSNAEENDRWRIFNRATDEYIHMNASTAREALINLYKKMDE